MTSYVAPANVLFDIDRAELRPGSTVSLRAIARSIAATAPHSPLLVEGHTDDLGSAAHGIALSQRRAAAVADWLVDEAGIDRARITERGWGEEKPAFTNATAAGRQANRRVVISVVRIP